MGRCSAVAGHHPWRSNGRRSISPIRSIDFDCRRGGSYFRIIPRERASRGENSANCRRDGAYDNIIVALGILANENKGLEVLSVQHNGATRMTAVRRKTALAVR